MKRLLAALLLAAALSYGAALAQGFPWHLYEPRKLAEVIAENTTDATGYQEKGQIVLTKGRPYRALVTFDGASRPMTAARKELLKMWVEAYGIDEKVLKLFENEFLFKEGSAEHWLPTQTPVSKHFAKELRKDDKVEIYVQFVGGKREKGSDRIDWLFLLNEFQKPAE